MSVRPPTIPDLIVDGLAISVLGVFFFQMLDLAAIILVSPVSQ